jgi:DUF4097 and DUF4098 domain-containing protein YvlB
MRKMIILLSIIALGLMACDLSVNRSIEIPKGEIIHRSLNSINGGIFVNDSCQIFGDCRTINGAIEIGNNSEIDHLQTINGRVRLGKNVIIFQDVESINGPVECNSGTHIKGNIHTINGSIDLTHTKVRNDIITYNGEITLTDSSIVQDDIIIKRSRRSWEHHRTLKINIKRGSCVEGDIIVKDKKIDVKVYLSEGGKVKGATKNVEVVQTDKI